MRRREFITLLGGATAWPLTARAQPSRMPVIGFLHLTSIETNRENLAVFRRGLEETGYVEGQSVVIDYRWAQGRNDRLSPLVDELVRRQVSVIVVLESTNGALAAKAATKTIPIVFMQGADPAQIGLVDSLNRPNPTNPVYAEAETREVQIATSAQGVRLLIANASQPSEIETALEDLVQQRASALQVSSDGFLLTHAPKIVALVAHHALPAIYAWPQYAAAGGLISYGTNIRDS